MSEILKFSSASGWKAERLDWHFAKVKTINHPDEQPLSVFLGAGVVLRDSRDDNHNRLGADLAKYQLVRKNDLVFNRLRTWQGGFGASSHQGIVSPAYIVCRPFSTVDSRFVHYQLLSSPYLAELTRISKFMPPSQFDILWEDLKMLMLRIPALPAQKAIADFLDRRTVAIDGLVKKKQKLLALLAEKRAAVINQAVTKGLHPNVPMKDSGVPWIGEIPTHWEVKKLAWVLIDGPRNGVSPQVSSDGSGTPSFAISAIRDGRLDIRADDVKYVVVSASERSRFGLRADDLLLVRGNGNINLVGATGIVESNPPDGYIYPDLLMRMRCGLAISSSYLCYCINSLAVRPQLNAAARTTVGTYKVNNEQVREIRVLVPPKREAEQIASAIKTQLAGVGAVAERVQQQLERLHEYRQALITAAVTGQLHIPEAA